MLDSHKFDPIVIIRDRFPVVAKIKKCFIFFKEFLTIILVAKINLPQNKYNNENKNQLSNWN